MANNIKTTPPNFRSINGTGLSLLHSGEHCGPTIGPEPDDGEREFGNGIPNHRILPHQGQQTQNMQSQNQAIQQHQQPPNQAQRQSTTPHLQNY